ncbi:hypothetical protein M422DRAFT_212738 [Sphaerobolus stellatus SS14]|uniref:Uncharacterized protein n=1 Tax=Sphaerobolus stellatus (strain SS14) TaxID=990650 RepID=A0A0C9TXV8_SPHS4|nr:hypothetical protein M422DRAFT_212738 [Sphaerobolus stellatus SS14]
MSHILFVSDPQQMKKRNGSPSRRPSCRPPPMPSSASSRAPRAARPRAMPPPQRPHTRLPKRTHAAGGSHMTNSQEGQGRGATCGCEARGCRPDR